MQVLKKSFLIVFIVLLLDQTLKFWIKTTMTLGQEFNVAGNWFIIHFTENNGMAFGMQFAGDYGKLFLSVFRIIAVLVIIYILYRVTRHKISNGFIISLSLILAGAIGNILDSAYYGLIFSDSTFLDVARFLPQEGGYSSFLHGKVVDMLYFPILRGTYPSWFPFWSGEEFIFFRPVFNIADSAISTGVVLLLFFQHPQSRREE
ncbi:MAG: lipoprotein signal peptidase [Bacteroidales bacterium]